jgi:hypothetical protein
MAAAAGANARAVKSAALSRQALTCGSSGGFQITDIVVSSNILMSI